MQKKLEDLNQAIAQAEIKHRQVQEQLEATTKQSSDATEQNDKAKRNVSQLQADLDNLMLLLLSTQEDCDGLRSQLKTINNVRHKTGAVRSQAEEEKLKQDLYVDRLTKDLERLTQQRDMYVAQAIAQREATQAVRQSLSEADKNMEVLSMARKQLLRQWKASLLGMARQHEALGAMQEAVREEKHQVILLDREIEGYRKSTTAEEEQNETLTMKLRCSEMDCTALKKCIIQKQSQQEALQSHYSKCASTLRETARAQATLTKDTTTHQDELNNQRKQRERKSSIRQELEEKILTHMQQQLTHSNAALYSQRLTGKTATLKMEKRNQLQLQEKEAIAVKLAIHNVLLQVDSLELTQDALQGEIESLDSFLTLVQTRISSVMKLIEQKQTTIINYNKKISEIVASTANEDLSPLEIKIHAITAQMEALAASFQSDKQQWMKLQEIVVGSRREIEAHSRGILILQTENTAMQQKNLRLDSEAEFERQVEIELKKTLKMLYRDQLKLNTLLGKNELLNKGLEQENALIETEFIHKLKEAARESVELQTRYENMQEEKELVLSNLMEAEQHIMLWEKNAQIVSETQAAVDSDAYKGEIRILKAEIHRREVQLSSLMKQQEELVRQSETAVERWSSIVQRKDFTTRNSHKKQPTKGALYLNIRSLHHSIKETHLLVGDCTREIQELQQGRTSLSDSLMQQRQQMTELHNTCYALDSEIMKRQDSKDRHPDQVRTLLSRVKRLQEVNNGGYKVSSSSEFVEAALQKVTQHLHTVGIITSRVCEEFPQHQEVLRRLTLEVDAHTRSSSL
uniref:Coiled-coil domain-containing protein 40 n=2 Tax=Gouania willdenowi TaxID=441366 RepID=A0A8C5GLB4_GOUWI